MAYITTCDSIVANSMNDVTQHTFKANRRSENTGPQVPPQPPRRSGNIMCWTTRHSSRTHTTQVWQHVWGLLHYHDKQFVLTQCVCVCMYIYIYISIYIYIYAYIYIYIYICRPPLRGYLFGGRKRNQGARSIIYVCLVFVFFVLLLLLLS